MRKTLLTLVTLLAVSAGFSLPAAAAAPRAAVASMPDDDSDPSADADLTGMFASTAYEIAYDGETAIPNADNGPFWMHIQAKKGTTSLKYSNFIAGKIYSSLEDAEAETNDAEFKGTLKISDDWMSAWYQYDIEATSNGTDYYIYIDNAKAKNTITVEYTAPEPAIGEVPATAYDIAYDGETAIPNADNGPFWMHIKAKKGTTSLKYTNFIAGKIYSSLEDAEAETNDAEFKGTLKISDDWMSAWYQYDIESASDGTDYYIYIDNAKAKNTVTVEYTAPEPTIGEVPATAYEIAYDEKLDVPTPNDAPFWMHIHAKQGTTLLKIEDYISGTLYQNLTDAEAGENGKTFRLKTIEHEDGSKSYEYEVYTSNEDGQDFYFYVTFGRYYTSITTEYRALGTVPGETAATAIEIVNGESTPIPSAEARGFWMLVHAPADGTTTLMYDNAMSGTAYTSLADAEAGENGTAVDSGEPTFDLDIMFFGYKMTFEGGAEGTDYWVYIDDAPSENVVSTDVVTAISAIAAGQQAAQADIYTLDGVKVARTNGKSLSGLGLARGTYIIKSGNKATKVMVK